MRYRIIFIFMIAFLLLISTSCTTNEDIQLEQLQPPTIGEEILVMQTNLGDIMIRFFPEISPKAVENFKSLAINGYYEGKMFSKVMTSEFFMFEDMEDREYYNSIWGEFFEDEFHNEYCHFRGAVSMANSGPNTNGSSFFIVNGNHIDQGILDVMKELGEDEGFSDGVIQAYEEIGGLYSLDYKHTVFGQVFEGMEVVELITNVEVDFNNQPIDSVVIEKIELVIYEGD